MKFFFDFIQYWKQIKMISTHFFGKKKNPSQFNLQQKRKQTYKIKIECKIRLHTYVFKKKIMRFPLYQNNKLILKFLDR